MKPILVETVLDALEMVRGKYPEHSIHKEGAANEWRFYLDSTCQDCVAVMTKNKRDRWKLEWRELPEERFNIQFQAPPLEEEERFVREG